MMYSSTVAPSHIGAIPTIEKRWVSLKRSADREMDKAIEDLTYMMTVTQTLDEHPLGNHDLCHRMRHIVSMLQSGRRNLHTREKIMLVIHKYLGAVRIFLMTARLEGVALYQKLFESTMIAIVREVEIIEKNS